jgi:hypothetical protein
MTSTTTTTPAHLNGVPAVNIAENLRVAVGNGRMMSSILREVVRLRWNIGRLAPAE